MVRYKYVYWCISHQQYVKPSAREKLQDDLCCKIVRFNLTLLQQVDFHTFSTWVNSQHTSRTHHSRLSLMSTSYEASKSILGRRTRAE